MQTRSRCRYCGRVIKIHDVDAPDVMWVTLRYSGITTKYLHDFCLNSPDINNWGSGDPYHKPIDALSQMVLEADNGSTD